MGDRNPPNAKNPGSPKVAHQWKRHTLSLGNAREHAIVHAALNPKPSPSPTTAERGPLADTNRRPSFLLKGRQVILELQWLSRGAFYN
jgi:hypothetical protein